MDWKQLRQEYIDYALATGNKELFNKMTGSGWLKYLKYRYTLVWDTIDEVEMELEKSGGVWD